MISIGNSEKVVKLNVEGSKENTMYVWRNDQVDTAALVQIVETGEWSKLELIDGFFAAICEKAGKIYLFCDRLGIYPLFYSATKNEVCAATRIPDLLTIVKSGLVPSNDGVVSLLLFGHHLGDETIFAGVRRCNGGETIVISNKGDIAERIPWKRKHVYQSKSSMGAGDLAKLFVKNVKKSLPANGKVLISLSGGFDSRAVLGAVLKCTELERVHTLTFGGADTYDFRIAKLVANKIGVKNTAFSITDQIFSDNFLSQRAGDYSYSYPALSTQPQEMITYLSRELSEGGTALWGVGGDAITGSHLHPSDVSLSRCDGPEDFACLLISKRCYLPLSVVSEITNLGEGEIITIISKIIEKSSLNQYDIPWQFLDAWDIFVRGRMETISVLPFNEQSWRCPHLGREYFNEMSTQHFEQKIHQNAYKRILACSFKSLFSLPTRRLRGRSLVGGRWESFCWTTRWRTAKVKRSLGKLIGRRVARIGRNYGKEEKFFNSAEGQKKLSRAVQIMCDKGILRRNASNVLDISQRNNRLGRIVLTLAYGFD